MYAYTRVDSPAGLLDLPAVGLQQLSKLRGYECVKDVECVFITAVSIIKLFAWEGDSGRHVLPETTSRGLCG